LQHLLSDNLLPTTQQFTRISCYHQHILRLLRNCCIPLNRFAQTFLIYLFFDNCAKPRDHFKTTTDLKGIHASDFLVETEHQKILISLFGRFKLPIEQALEVG
jgi:hypothetical protein